MIIREVITIRVDSITSRVASKAEVETHVVTVGLHMAGLVFFHRNFTPHCFSGGGRGGFDSGRGRGDRGRGRGGYGGDRGGFGGGQDGGNNDSMRY